MEINDLLQHPKATGAPGNDTDPIGGAVDDSGGNWVEGVSRLFGQVVVDAPDGADNVYYGDAAKAIKATATGSLETPSIYLRTASHLNTTPGTASIRSSSPNDAGAVRVIGKIGATWTPEEVTISGTNLANGSSTFAASSVWAWEYLVGGAPAKPEGNLTCYIDGELCAIIFGTGTPPAADIGNGNTQANALHKIAVGTAKNTAIGWSGTNNRRTAPDEDVSAFSTPHRWPGDDTSIALAADLVALDEHEFVVELTIPAGIPDPVGDGWECDVVLVGGVGA